MTHPNNNFIANATPWTRLAPDRTVTGTLPIVSPFSLIVTFQHDDIGNDDLQEMQLLFELAKLTNPELKLFGYTSLDSQRSLADWLNDPLQYISINGSPSGGVFNLSYQGATRSAPFDASATTLQAVLRGIDGLEGVTVSGAAPDWIVRMDGVALPATLVGNAGTLSGDSGARVSVGGATVTPEWWLANVPRIDGIFIDGFGGRFRGGPGMQPADLDAALDYCHGGNSAGRMLSAFVNPPDLARLFASRPDRTPSHLGASDAVDYFLLADFYTVNGPDIYPAYELPVRRDGRLRTAAEQQTSTLRAVLAAGAAAAATYTQLDWDILWAEALDAAIDFVGVLPYGAFTNGPVNLNAFFHTNQRSAIAAPSEGWG